MRFIPLVGGSADAEAPGLTTTERFKVERDDLEDIRLAVVMNGGVSLAIWMGGVTNEINRLVSARETARALPYRQLLDVVQSTARVDVIAGASAGGINGAFLALATAYGSDLSSLGELWARQGSFEALLRDPLEKNPPSLLRGDDYFLKRLHEAFDALLPSNPDRAYRPPGSAPIDLTMTTTLTRGERLHFFDDYGTVITEVNHRGSFRFARDETTAEQEDPFADRSIVAKLALAARSTASFPGAFEPSMIPIGASGRDRFHPDMGPHCDFSQTQFVLDGGVLVNQPIGPALDAIFARRADRQVRRVLAYVNPDPRACGSIDPESPDPPSLAQVALDSLVTLPAAQSVHSELEQIQRHNERARDQRLARIDFIRVLQRDVFGLAQEFFEAYRLIRKRREVIRIADRVLRGMAERSKRAVQSGEAERGAQPPPAWTREDLIDALNDPKFSLVTVTAPAQDGDGLRLREWGIPAVERLGTVAVDLYKRAIWIAPVESTELRRSLRQSRAHLHEQVCRLRDLRMRDVDFWEDEGRKWVPAPPEKSSERPETLKRWVAEAFARWPGSGEGDADAARDEVLAQLDAIGKEIVGVVNQSARVLRETLRFAERSHVSGAAEEADKLRQVLDLIFGPDGESGDPREVLARFLALEVCDVVLMGSEEIEQEVELIQVSGNTESSFGSASATEEKLAGAQLGHFGAFYKKCWRVNDWIWGRIDGASRLCLAVLSPQRLRQLAYSTEVALKLVRSAATHATMDGDREALERAFREDEDECRKELTFLDERTLPVPPSLPTCAMAIARRIHLEILREELPRLHLAAKDDLRQGARPQGNAASFMTAYEAAVLRHGGGPPPAGEVFRLFEEARIGSERVRDEFPSNLLATTASTASAVLVSVAQSDTAGLGPARLLGRALRGFTLALYALTRGAVSGSQVGTTLVNLAMALGGALLAVALWAPNAPPIVGALGISIVLAGVAAAALRARFSWYGLVLAALALVAVAAAAAPDLSQLVPQLRVIGGIVAVVLLAVLLGSLPAGGALPAGRRAGRRVALRFEVELGPRGISVKAPGEGRRVVRWDAVTEIRPAFGGGVSVHAPNAEFRVPAGAFDLTDGELVDLLDRARAAPERRRALEALHAARVR